MPSFASHLAEYLEVEGKGIILMKPGVGRLRESVEGEERKHEQRQQMSVQTG